MRAALQVDGEYALEPGHPAERRHSNIGRAFIVPGDFAGYLGAGHDVGSLVGIGREHPVVPNQMGFGPWHQRWHFAQKWEALGPYWQRAKLRRTGVPAMRLIRYADDFVVMVHGQREDAQALWREVEDLLAPTGLSLSVEKTRVCHIDEGFDFLGWRVQRRRWRGCGGKQAVYTYPSKKALSSVTTKVRSLTRRAKHRTLSELLHSVNRVLRGWCEYFRYGVSARTFGYLDHFTWHRIFRWLCKRHAKIGKKALVRRVLPNWQITHGRVSLFKPQEVSIIRYRYRGTRIPTPWASPA